MNAVAQEVVALLQKRNETISCAESISGGALTSEIVSVPGASHVLPGAIVAYSNQIKIDELSVPGSLLDEFGVVSEEVALAMAKGARAKFSSSWAISLTGVAGPGPSHGVEAGTVWLAIIGPEHEETVKLAISGDRENVRRGAVESAVGVLARILASRQ
ncbi:MAG: CinA family protein [Candidatus Nanopelagicaceae bacterium]|nr:CinA family protein [Candidatus Nanopelagicaceae bacterium]